jgi:hypothetical protein
MKKNQEKIVGDFNSVFGIAFDVDRLYVVHRLNFLQSPFSKIKLSFDLESAESLEIMIKKIGDIDPFAAIFIAGETSENADYIRTKRNELKVIKDSVPPSLTRRIQLSTEQDKLIAAWMVAKGTEVAIGPAFEEYAPEIDEYYNDIEQKRVYVVRGEIHPVFKAMLCCFVDFSWSDDEEIKKELNMYEEGALTRASYQDRFGYIPGDWGSREAFSGYDAQGLMRRF